MFSSCPFTDLDYADDIAIFAPSACVLQEALTVLQEEANLVGMQISWPKTKLMAITPKPTNHLPLKICNKEVVFVDSFTYREFDMATVNIPAPKPLNINDKSAFSLWKSWKKTWERFEIATGIDEAGDKKRVCTLLSIIGEDAVKVFDTFEYGDGESEDSIQDVLNKF